MRFATPLLFVSTGLLASCGGPNKVIKDVYSPDGRYHVEVRQCPAVGSMSGGTETQASILDAKKVGTCHSAIGTIAQFSVNEPDDQLQLEWISDSELRAWHPNFNPAYGPEAFSHPANNSPVKVTFARK
ncbi:hypothetical protein [Sphingomonas sp.]|uniref:hypothetical protein n=1 Tax=Sphingomonas sp. TaxID=28214 RepID=UPI003B3A3895